MNARLHPHGKTTKSRAFETFVPRTRFAASTAVHRIRIRAASLFTVLLLTACAGTQATTPRSRVAKDLGCTTEGTAVEQIAPVPGEKAARWQVTGCGRTAVYLCTTPVRECWREGEVAPHAAEK